jgi:hypothetical protein
LQFNRLRYPQLTPENEKAKRAKHLAALAVAIAHQVNEFPKQRQDCAAAWPQCHAINGTQDEPTL